MPPERCSILSAVGFNAAGFIKMTRTGRIFSAGSGTFSERHGAPVTPGWTRGTPLFLCVIREKKECHWAIQDLRMTSVPVSELLGISQSTLTRAAYREASIKQLVHWGVVSLLICSELQRIQSQMRIGAPGAKNHITIGEKNVQ
jgi:hypothetical protein